MRVFSRLGIILVFSILTLSPTSVFADTAVRPPTPPPMPDRIADFRWSPKQPLNSPLRFLRPEDKFEDFGITSYGNRGYISDKGERIAVDVIKTISDSSAYALLSSMRAKGQFSKLEGIGSEAIVSN
ncbi:MAG: hypothetical protein ACRD9R_09325, partial [Pyrinomonadaceae bacterium]